jgi:murein DD-endopeptidase MepM/ murein hydrolase activator NlpD
MLALSPLLLQRLGTLERGAAALRVRPDGVIARHAQIEGSLPELVGAQQRLDQERTQKSRLRQIASRQLGEVEDEARLLGTEQARLTRLLLRAQTAMLASAGPAADRRALPDPRAMRSAPHMTASVDKGSTDPTGRTVPVAGARNGVAARALAVVHGPDAAVAMAEPAEAAWPTTPRPPARAKGLHGVGAPAWPRTSDARATAALQVRFPLDDGPSGRRAGRAREGRWTAPPLPVPDGAHDWVLVARGGPELSIPAAPGQAVAAPVDGRVVFAGRFKSYGLLLILEHEGEYHTLLWGFARLDVHHGDQVGIGQIVGIMDARGDYPPVLHVERRRNGRPINIAASSSGIQG